MIITCIFIAMASLGFILIKSNMSWDAEITGDIMCLIGVSGLIVSLIIIIGTRATSDNVIQKKKYSMKDCVKGMRLLNQNMKMCLNLT